MHDDGLTETGMRSYVKVSGADFRSSSSSRSSKLKFPIVYFLTFDGYFFDHLTVDG